MMRLCVRGLASSTAAPKRSLVESSLCTSTRVLTIRFNNEKKLNAWTEPLMRATLAALETAKNDSQVAGVVITGTGKYYSAGVDLSSTIQLMSPSVLIRNIRDQNEVLFKVS